MTSRPVEVIGARLARANSPEIQAGRYNECIPLIGFAETDTNEIVLGLRFVHLLGVDPSRSLGPLYSKKSLSRILDSADIIVLYVCFYGFPVFCLLKEQCQRS